MSAQSAISNSSPIPLYHQIATLLIARIHEGEYPPGKPLPTEDALQSEFSVSRATVRQAVMELVRAGMITRRRGIGSWVSPGAKIVGERRFRGSLADLMAERRASIAGVEITSAVELPVRVSDLLGRPAAPVTLIRRRWEFEDRPLAFKLNYLVGIPRQRLTKQLLMREPHLMRVIEAGGVKIARATQSIRAQVADHGIAQSLEVAIGAPVLFVERLVFTEAENPVELAQTWYRGDSYEYAVHFHLSDGFDVDAHLA